MTSSYKTLLERIMTKNIKHLPQYRALPRVIDHTSTKILTLSLESQIQPNYIKGKKRKIEGYSVTLS